tara:strand:- start:830 stop:1492 length:663 start_codon:yes stop_codon:yes gene_type:complete
MHDYIFITGTNTDVGKTYFGLSLIKYLLQYKECIAFKPIETGCKLSNKKLIPADSAKYYKLLDNKFSLEQVNPYRFLEPVSPYLAIKKAKKRIYLRNYFNKLKIISKSKNTILIEGAGGAFSPFALDGLNIDFMKLVKSKNILIVKDELGCIGSAVSHYYSFKAYKVPLNMIILNTHKKNKMDNLNEIKKYVDVPVYTFGKTSKDNSACFAAIKKILLLV